MVVSAAASSPVSEMYSMIRASSGVLPVRSPKPNSVLLTAPQPLSQAVTPLTSTLWKSLWPCHSSHSPGTPASSVKARTMRCTERGRAAPG